MPSPLREPPPLQAPGRDPKRGTCCTCAPRSGTGRPPGPRRAVRRHRAEPRPRNQEPAAESRADRQHHPPPCRPLSQASVPPGRIRASTAAGRTEGGPPVPRGVLTWSERPDPRRKEQLGPGPGCSVLRRGSTGCAPCPEVTAGFLEREPEGGRVWKPASRGPSPCLISEELVLNYSHPHPQPQRPQSSLGSLHEAAMCPLRL